MIPDGCHDLKLIRNSIASCVNKYDPDGNIISWKYLENLVTYQELNGLHAGTKIRRQHINWEDNKMNVRLAAQTLSESVSVALKYLENDEMVPQFQGASATAKFCSIINDAFDILNSIDQFNSNKAKIGICNSNIQDVTNRINSHINYLKNLKLFDGMLVIHSKKSCIYWNNYCFAKCPRYL